MANQSFGGHELCDGHSECTRQFNWRYKILRHKLYDVMVRLVLSFLHESFDCFRSEDQRHAFRWIHGTRTLFLLKAPPDVWDSIRHKLRASYIRNVLRAVRIDGGRLHALKHAALLHRTKALSEMRFDDDTFRVNDIHKEAAALIEAMSNIPSLSKVIDMLKNLRDNINRPLCSVPFSFDFNFRSTGGFHIIVRLYSNLISKELVVEKSFDVWLFNSRKETIPIVQLPVSSLPERCVHQTVTKINWCKACKKVWDTAHPEALPTRPKRAVKLIDPWAFA